MMKNFLMGILLLSSNYAFCQQTIIVSPGNSEENLSTRTITTPDITSALKIAAQSSASEINIYLREGNYHLNTPLEITSREFKNKKLSITPYNQEKVTICGGPVLQTQWEKYKKGIWKTKTDIQDFDQLFINGEQRILARYPNYQEGQILNGTAL